MSRKNGAYTDQYSFLYEVGVELWQSRLFVALRGVSMRLAPGLLAVEWHSGPLISQKQFNRLPKRWRAGGGGMPHVGNWL
jgi:hypothetical protein